MLPLNTENAALLLVAVFGIGYPIAYAGAPLSITLPLGLGLGAAASGIYLLMAAYNNPQGVSIPVPEEMALDQMWVLENARKKPEEASIRYLGGDMYEVVFRGKKANVAYGELLIR